MSLDRKHDVILSDHPYGPEWADKVINLTQRAHWQEMWPRSPDNMMDRSGRCVCGEGGDEKMENRGWSVEGWKLLNVIHLRWTTAGGCSAVLCSATTHPPATLFSALSSCCWGQKAFQQPAAGRISVSNTDPERMSGFLAGRLSVWCPAVWFRLNYLNKYPIIYD